MIELVEIEEEKENQRHYILAYSRKSKARVERFPPPYLERPKRQSPHYSLRPTRVNCGYIPPLSRVSRLPNFPPEIWSITMTAVQKP